MRVGKNLPERFRDNETSGRRDDKTAKRRNPAPKQLAAPHFAGLLTRIPLPKHLPSHLAGRLRVLRVGFYLSTRYLELRDDGITRPRDHETTGRRDNETTGLLKNTGVLRYSQSFSVVRGSLASEGLQMWYEMIVPWMGHTMMYFPFAASEFRAADAPLSRQATPSGLATLDNNS